MGRPPVSKVQKLHDHEVDHVGTTTGRTKVDERLHVAALPIVLDSPPHSPPLSGEHPLQEAGQPDPASQTAPVPGYRPWVGYYMGREGAVSTADPFHPLPRQRLFHLVRFRQPSPESDLSVYVIALWQQAVRTVRYRHPLRPRLCPETCTAAQICWDNKGRKSHAHP